MYQFKKKAALAGILAAVMLVPGNVYADTSAMTETAATQPSASQETEAMGSGSIQMAPETEAGTDAAETETAGTDAEIETELTDGLVSGPEICIDMGTAPAETENGTETETEEAETEEIEIEEATVEVSINSFSDDVLGDGRLDGPVMEVVTYIVTTNLNIRDEPDGEVIGKYDQGTQVIVLENSGEWARTEAGWVSSEYLERGEIGEDEDEAPTLVLQERNLDAGLSFDQKTAYFSDEYEAASKKYQSDTTFVTSSYGNYGEGSFWLTHIIVRNPAFQLHEGMSYDDFGGTRETTSSFAARTGAIVATNASQFWYDDGTSYDGVIFSEGQLIRGGNTTGMEVCLKGDGTLYVPGDQLTSDYLETQGIIGSWTAADPVLIANGEALDFPPSQLSGAYPRTAIGMVEQGEYYIITAGSGNYKGGLTYQELQEIFVTIGCTFARPLDGGGSATLVINGELVNSPATGEERPVADFFYITD